MYTTVNVINSAEKSYTGMEHTKCVILFNLILQEP